MSVYTALVIQNVSLIVMVGIMVYYTQSPWMLLGLLFLFHSNITKDKQ